MLFTDAKAKHEGSSPARYNTDLHWLLQWGRITCYILLILLRFYTVKYWSQSQCQWWNNSKMLSKVNFQFLPWYTFLWELRYTKCLAASNGEKAYAHQSLCSFPFLATLFSLQPQGQLWCAGKPQTRLTQLHNAAKQFSFGQISFLQQKRWIVWYMIQCKRAGTEAGTFIQA